jgi:A/G-specific adenine glycosylase
MTQDERIEAVRERLLAWFRRRRRDLPWRRDRDPYRVWVSEVMLQQTRVSAARPYFLQFMARFPDVSALAAAALEDVLKAWEGLGYYARAHNLHKAARAVACDHGGRLPRSVKELTALPGIGPSTAGAIASIAFGLREPVLDGNVTRVLCRVFRVRGIPSEAQTARRLWRLARRLVSAGDARRCNEALMDLGAGLCTPRRPDCDACPLRDVCLARRSGQQDKLPARRRPGPLPHQTVAVGVIRKGGRILIDRRRAEGLLAGLWELPGGKVREGESPAAAVRREVREEVGIHIRVARPLTTVEHAYSHFRVTIRAFSCTHVSGRARAIGCAAVRWVRPVELDDFAFPAANRKIIAAIMAETGEGEGDDPVGRSAPRPRRSAAQRAGEPRPRRRRPRRAGAT